MAEPAASTVDAGPGGETGNVKNGRTTSTGNADASVTVVKKDGGTVVVDADVMEDADLPDVIDIIDTGVIDAGCVQNPPPPPADAGGLCSYQVPLPCAVNPAGPISQADCQKYCGSAAFGCYAMDPTSIGGGDAGIGGGDATWVLECYSCAVGRRPEGYARAANANDGCASEVGRYFAIMAELEAASVWSFERLARELEAHGAPRSLVRRAKRAADDERRHTKTTQALAARFGARGAEPRVTDGEVRAIEAIALENLIEGCVRETYGALIATRQAEAASDPVVRRAMRKIAADETAHAALSWDVASFFAGQLDAQTMTRMRDAMREAIETLAREVSVDPPSDVRESCGLPGSEEAARLVDGMRELLWAA